MMELQKRQRIETAARFQKHLDKVFYFLIIRAKIWLVAVNKKKIPLYIILVQIDSSQKGGTKFQQ